MPTETPVPVITAPTGIESETKDKNISVVVLALKTVELTETVCALLFVVTTVVPTGI